MPIIRWKPLKELDELFEDFSHGTFRLQGWDLAADVYEDNGNVIVEMHIPGIDPDKIDIEIEDTYLRVAGSREEKEEVEGKHYYRKEIRRGSFERAINLPAPVIQGETRAEFTEGILKITLPKVQKREPSKIKVTKK